MVSEYIAGKGLCISTPADTRRGGMVDAPDITCLDCPYCYDDDGALYCYEERCVREGDADGVDTV